MPRQGGSRSGGGRGASREVGHAGRWGRVPEDKTRDWKRASGRCPRDGSAPVGMAAMAACSGASFLFLDGSPPSASACFAAARLLLRLPLRNSVRCWGAAFSWPERALARPPR